MSDLIPLENPVPAELFVTGGLDSILARIDKEFADVVYDMDVAKDRKACASAAAAIARSKTYIDNLGKEFVSGLKARAKTVDVERKKARDHLDALKARVRQPLTDYEEREQQRIQALNERLTVFRVEIPFMATSTQVDALVQQVSAVVVDETWQEFRDEAQLQKDAALHRLTTALAEISEAEQQAAAEEEARIAKETAERKDREERIAREATEKAEREAALWLRRRTALLQKRGTEREREAVEKAAEEEARIAKEQLERKEREERIAREAAEKAEREAARKIEEATRREREAKEAAERAEQQRLEQEKRAALREREAVEKAARDAEQRELARQETIRRLEEQRRADEQHRASVHAEINAAFAAQAGVFVLQEDFMNGHDYRNIDVAALLTSGSIPHVKVIY